MKIFKNPILPKPHADPWVIRKDGCYYYCGSGEDHSIYIIKAEKLSEIGKNKKVIVWRAPENGDHCKELWAPELHWINNRWYIYYAADDGNNDNHRMFVIQSESENVFGPYIDKGKITDSTDKWAIDGTVLKTMNGKLFFIWSGWDGDVNEAQHLYIAPMSASEPWKVIGDRVKLSSPVLSWERTGFPYVNEGPQVIQRNGKIFLVYSASGSWSGNYCLGMLSIGESGDVLNPNLWVKEHLPVFFRNDEENVYGVGHCSFTTSLDGKEDWIIYHAMDTEHAGWDGRSARAQKFTWNEDGTPNFGKPISTDKEIPVPSGE